MRVAGSIVALVAIAVMVGSAAVVVSKGDQPQLAVSVSGVPGYVYYDRAYDLTIEYANHGGAISGPVEVVAVLPETFALSQHIGDPERHGERLVWILDGLDAGEFGTFAISVRGTLPEDLTNAVYDLPGYSGHTAFVEGFEMPVTLTAGTASTSTLAIADTGAHKYPSLSRSARLSLAPVTARSTSSSTQASSPVTTSPWMMTPTTLSPTHTSVRS